MAKIYKIFLICIVCMFAIESHSANRNPEQALQVAYKMLSEQASNGEFRGKGAPVRNNLKIVKQSDSYYVVNTGEGFVLVSTDDQMPEILGYSNQGEYNEANIPPALRMWLDSYDSAFRSWQKVQSAPNTNLKNHEKRSPKANVLDSIAPLIATQWGQDTPYNIFCPVDCNGDTCPTGCVTTALAQIMNYWKWPQQGEGEHTLEYICKEDSSYRRTYSVSFETTYYWEQMREKYSSNDTVDKSVDAVATLMYHLGVAQDIHYVEEGTGVSLGEMRENSFPALFSHFGYDTVVQVIAREYYDAENLEYILHDELMRNRPIFVSGIDIKAGGHAFVCDGYENHYFHFNWGWNGLLDGWFLLAALSPSFWVINYDFNYYISFFIGIQPNHANSSFVYQGLGLVADSIVTSAASIQGGDTIDVSIYGISNVGLKKYQGPLGIAIYPLNSNTATQLFPFIVRNIETILYYGEGKGEMGNINFSITPAIPEGIYKIGLVYQNETNNWLPVPMLYNGYFNIFTKTDGIKTRKSIYIYSYTGQLVHHFTTWDDMGDIHNLHLPSGVYIIKQGEETLKIIL